MNIRHVGVLILAAAPWCVASGAALAVGTPLDNKAQDGAVASPADVTPRLLTGILLDARRRVPLPEYTLEVRAGDHLERLTTDEKGHFTSALPYAPGPIAILPIDSESTGASPQSGGLELPGAATGLLTPEWKGAPLEIEVACGPTFEMTFKPLVDEPNPPAIAASVARLHATAPGSIDEGAQLRSVVRLAANGRVWVRFAALPPGVFTEPFGARLEIRTMDGLWNAEADVTQSIKDDKRALELSWKPCARWTGVLRDGKGRGVPRTWVVLTRTSENGRVVERRRTCCDGQGRYEFSGLEPGVWTLAARPLRHADFTSEKRTLAARADSKLNITMDAARDLASIQGRALGAPVVDGVPAPEPARIILRRAGETLPLETTMLAWTTDEGRYVAPFTIPALPACDYELQFVPPAGDEAAWEKRTLRAKPSPDPVTFLRH